MSPLTLIVEMVGSVGVQEHAIRIVHKVLRRREVNLRPQRACVVARNRNSRGHCRFHIDGGRALGEGRG